MGSKNTDYKESKEKKKKNKPTKDLDAKNNDKIHHEGGGGRKIIADPRFASVHSDPRFQKVTKQNSKVAIDSRFNRMFTDKNFASSSAKLDKRGKPKKHKSESSLRHYYRIEEEGEDNDDRMKEMEKKLKIVNDKDNSGEEVEEESEEEELEKLDLAAEGSESSSQSEASDSEVDAESTTDEEDEEVFYEDDLSEVEVCCEVNYNLVAE